MGLPQAQLKHYFFNTVLNTGDEKLIMENGPIKITATCESLEVSMQLEITHNKDVLVFGESDDDQGLDGYPLSNNVLTAGDTYSTEIWDVSLSGIDADDGAIVVITDAETWYVRWSGDSFAGVRNSAGLPFLGGNCAIAGVFHYSFPNMGNNFN